MSPHIEQRQLLPSLVIKFNVIIIFVCLSFDKTDCIIIARNKFNSTTYGMGESADKMYYPKVDFVKSLPPKWTMSGRSRAPEADRSIPGPKYYPKACNLKSAPSISLGIRHSEFCSTGLPAHYAQANEI